jgi:hypothetical protein
LGNKKVQKAEPFLCFSNIMGGVAFGESLLVIWEIKKPKKQSLFYIFQILWAGLPSASPLVSFGK